MVTDKLVDFDHVTDYISREAAIKEFCDDCMDREWCKSNGESCSRIKNINSVPAADVRPVVRGTWMKCMVEKETPYYKSFTPVWSCSGCRKEYDPSFCMTINFCPNCGADMREVKEDGEKA